MTIYNKDGSVYSLIKPNPAMQTQLPWDKTQIVLINMKYDGCVIKDKRNPLVEFNKKIFDIGDTLKQDTKPVTAKQFIEEIQETKPSEPMPVKETFIEPPKQEVVPDKIKQSAVRFFCVPTKTEKVVDELYGSNRLRTVYGDKIMFEGVILYQDDLQFKFWTNILLQENTIVYPQIMDKRWWKIKKTEKKDNGYIYDAVASNLNPDFS